MTELEKKLARRLLYLPLDVNEKVFLWLTYRGLKPVSEITVTRRNYAVLRRLLSGKNLKTNEPVSDSDSNGQKIRRIRKWVKDASLFIATESKNDTSWHIGKEKDKVTLSEKILHRFDYDNEYKSGILLGYPEESVKAYAHNRVLKLGENQTPMVWPGMKFFDPFLKDKYYTQYLFYALRADRVKTDSQVAKKWADIIRKEVPTLAKWFEKSIADERKRENEPDEVWQKRLRRNGQTAEEIIAEYSKNAKTMREVFKMAVDEFWDSYLDDFLLASIAYQLSKHLTKVDLKDKELLAILKQAEGLYKQESHFDLKDKKARILTLRDWLNKNK